MVKRCRASLLIALIAIVIAIVMQLRTVTRDATVAQFLSSKNPYNTSTSNNRTGIPSALTETACIVRHVNFLGRHGTRYMSKHHKAVTLVNELSSAGMCGPRLRFPLSDMCILQIYLLPGSRWWFGSVTYLRRRAPRRACSPLVGGKSCSPSDIGLRNGLMTLYIKLSRKTLRRACCSAPPTRPAPSTACCLSKVKTLGVVDCGSPSD